MADRLDELVSGVQKHIADKRAELTALQTQLKALQSAHADLHQEVDKVQAELAEVRQAVADSSKELAKRRAAANKIADGIVTAAHDKRAQAEKDIEKSLEDAANKTALASKQLSDIEAMIVSKEEEYNSLVSDVYERSAKLAAVKAEARKIADG